MSTSHLTAGHRSSPHGPPSPGRSAPWTVPLLALGSVMLLGGCYSHVVAEEGVGTGVDEVYEPNLKEPEEGGPSGRGWDDIRNPLP